MANVILLCGQSGGSILCQLFRKPLIIYDVAFPYSFIICPKTFIRKYSIREGRYMKLNELMAFSSMPKCKRLVFENINSINLVDLYLEMKKKDVYSKVFLSILMK